MNINDYEVEERDCETCKHYKYDSSKGCWACSSWDCEYTPEGDYVEES